MKKTATIGLSAVALLSAGLVAASHAQGAPEDGTIDREARRAMIQDEMKARITAIDLNGDGEITRAEVDAKREADFAAADTNADGGVSSDEARAWQEARREERRENRAQAMFTRADTDGSGQLGIDEFGTRQVSLFERLDADGDGVLTDAEIDAAAEKMGKRGGKRRFGRRGDR